MLPQLAASFGYGGGFPLYLLGRRGCQIVCSGRGGRSLSKASSQTDDPPPTCMSALGSCADGSRGGNAFLTHASLRFRCRACLCIGGRICQGERKRKQWSGYTRHCDVVSVRQQQNARGGGPVPPPPSSGLSCISRCRPRTASGRVAFITRRNALPAGLCERRRSPHPPRVVWVGRAHLSGRR